MPKKATAADAELILKLYDLRREAEMRKARAWFATEFWPQSADDIMKVAMDLGSQHNAWLRQVGGYWEMAATLVLHGAINEELFLQPGCSGEMFFCFAKIQPHLKELRTKMGNPDVFVNTEKVAMKTKVGRDRIKLMAERQAALLTRRAEAAKAN